MTVHGGTGGNDFRVRETPAAPATLNAGLGVDWVTVNTTSGPLAINGEDSQIPGRPDGVDTVNVGKAGSVRGTRSEVVISNELAYVAVTVDDSADAVARTGVIYEDGGYHRVNGLTPGGGIVVRSRDVRSLTVLAGGGDNTFRVRDTPTSETSGGATTTLRTGSGNDHVTVFQTAGALVLGGSGGTDTTIIGSDVTGLDRVQGAVSFAGQQGDTSVTIRDRTTAADRALTHMVTATQNTRTAAAPVNVGGVKALPLQTGRARDTINVRATRRPDPRPASTSRAVPATTRSASAPAPTGSPASASTASTARGASTPGI